MVRSIRSQSVRSVLVKSGGVEDETLNNSLLDHYSCFGNNMMSSCRYVLGLVCAGWTLFVVLTSFTILRHDDSVLFNTLRAKLLSRNSASFEISSPAFAYGDSIPSLYNTAISPPLQWNHTPSYTKSFALIMQDVNASIRHWIVYDIPSTVKGFSEGMSQLPEGCVVLQNDWNRKRYDGPATVSSVVNEKRHYEFHLYALNISTLDVTTKRRSITNFNDLQRAINRYIIQKATLMGTHHGLARSTMME